MSDVSPLQVKMGIGYGKCALLYVGGIFNRSEFFTVGEGLEWALGSEGEATGGGQVIVADCAWQYASKYYTFEKEINNDKGEKYWLVYDACLTDIKGGKNQLEGIKPSAGALNKIQSMDQQELLKMEPALRGCVPAAIVNYLTIGKEFMGCETRSLTIMFANLGLELSATQTVEGREYIQDVVTTVQKMCYRQQGSVNKLLLDDKGSTLICLWGLTPLAHEDDAARALTCAYELRKALMQIKNKEGLGVSSCYGITSGEVFTGIAGTSGSRKEYTCLGDVANLSARIMYWPKAKNIKGKIYCDLNTRNLASNFYAFQYHGNQEFKGKSISLGVYEPIFKIPGEPHFVLPPELSPGEYTEVKGVKQQPWMPKVTARCFQPEEDILLYLKAHQNPLECDRGETPGRYKPPKKKQEIMGCDEIFRKIIQDIAHYQNKGFDHTECPQLISIKGELGAGKTLFVQHLVDKLRTNKREFEYYAQGDTAEFPFFFSSLNSETSYHFLNIWRPILQQMMLYLMAKDNLKDDQILRILIDSQNEDYFKYWNVLCKIFNINSTIPNKHAMTEQTNTFFKIPQINFISQDGFALQDEEAIIDILVDFILIVVGQLDDASMDLQENYKEACNGNRKHNKKGSSQSEIALESQPPFVVVMDTVHFLDANSWNFLEKLCTGDCKRLTIIMVMQTDNKDDIRIADSAKTAFKKVWVSEAFEGLQMIDMPNLTQDLLSSIINSMSEEYQSTWREEVSMMTDIVNNPSIKDQAKSDQWVKDLVDKWQLGCKMGSVDTKILECIITKCGGNPLLCMSFFIQLLHNDWIYVQDTENTGYGKVFMRPKFIESLRLNDFTEIPVPRVSMKLNCAFLDKVIDTVCSAAKARKTEEPIKEIIKCVCVMKSATVIGDQFYMQPLAKVQPLLGESFASLTKLIHVMQNHDFIEIMDSSDPKNYLCRFNKPFLRESLYQIILYRDCKKGMHGVYSEYLQSQLTGSVKKGIDPEVQTGRLRQHMLVSQDVLTAQELSFQTRTAIVVKQILNQMQKDPKGIAYKGNLGKEGQGFNKNQSARLIVITSTHFKWYHDEDEHIRDDYLGSIPLTMIFAVVASKMNTGNSTAFSISASNWIKKRGGKDKGQRDFFYAAKTMVERDEWMAAIDFMRTKAMYEAYAVKNIPIKFPLQNDDGELSDEEEVKNKSEILYDFGKGFKQTLSGINPNASPTKQKAVEKASENRRQSVMHKLCGEVKDEGVPKEELAKRLKLLYSVGMTTFLDHLQSTSVKMTIKQREATLGSENELQSSKMSNLIEKRLQASSQVKFGQIQQSEKNQKPSRKSNKSSQQDIQREAIDKTVPSEDSFKPENTNLEHMKVINQQFGRKINKDPFNRRHSSVSAGAKLHSHSPSKDNIGAQSMGQDQLAVIKEDDMTPKEVQPDLEDFSSATKLTSVLKNVKSRDKILHKMNTETLLLAEPNQTFSERGSSFKSKKREEAQTPDLLPISKLNRKSVHYGDSHKKSSTQDDQTSQGSHVNELTLEDTMIAKSLAASNSGTNTMKALEKMIAKSIQKEVGAIKAINKDMFQEQMMELTHQMQQQHQQQLLNMSQSFQAQSPLKQQTQSHYQTNLNESMVSTSSRASGKPAGITSKNDRVDMLLNSEAPLSKAHYLDSDAEDPISEEDDNVYIRASESLPNQQFDPRTINMSYEINRHNRPMSFSPADNSSFEVYNQTRNQVDPLTVQKQIEEYIDKATRQRHQKEKSAIEGIKQIHSSQSRSMSGQNSSSVIHPVPDNRHMKADHYRGYQSPPQRDTSQTSKKSNPTLAATLNKNASSERKRQKPVYVPQQYLAADVYFPPPEQLTAKKESYAIQDEPVHKKSSKKAKQQILAVGPPLAVAIKNSACQLRGKDFVVPEGATVEILEQIENLQMYRVRYNGQLGVFSMIDFKKKLGYEPNAPISPVAIIEEEVERQNFFKAFSQRELAQKKIGQIMKIVDISKSKVEHRQKKKAVRSRKDLNKYDDK